MTNLHIELRASRQLIMHNAVQTCKFAIVEFGKKHRLHILVENLATALREPDLYPSQDLPGQLMDLVVETFDVEVHLVELLGSLAVRVREEEREGGPTLESLVHPILDRLGDINIAEQYLSPPAGSKRPWLTLP